MTSRSEVFKLKEFSLKSYRLVNAESSTEGSDHLIPLGEGGSGIVFKAVQLLHENVFIERAVKFFMYRDDIAKFTKHKYTGPISNDDFIQEIKNISSFSHQNLISVVDAGIYESGEYQIPYIVTDYINGPTLRHVISPTSEKESPRYRERAEQARRDLIANPLVILDILLKVCNAIKHLHDAEYYHCDIAPKNIFLTSTPVITPVLGDLGIAKNFRHERASVFVAGTKEYLPNSVITSLNKEIQWTEYKTFQPHWDLYAFAKTGLELLDLIDEHVQAWISPLRTTLRKIIDGNGYESINKLRERLEFLQPFHREVARVPELSPGLTGKRRNLMPVESLSISSRVGTLIHHPSLLRLGNVPQLTTANLLFPGANHTRYEHSLGVMETVRRYLTALLDQELFLEHLSVEKIETALICALLSNVTRFPLSNIFHEIKSKNREELGLFSRESLLSEIETIKDKKDRTIQDIISQRFPSVDYKCVKNILLGRKSDFDDEDRLIYSFLNSSLDARVVDFVRRDSLHLGIVKGDIIDLDELLPHFTINNHKLALKVTGVSVAEQIISLRYWLFQRIYWNSPNRKFCSMIRHVILELDEKTSFSTDFRSMALKRSHNGMLSYLLEYAKNKGISASQDICERLCRKDQDLFRTVLDLGQQDRSDFVAVCKAISDMDYKQILSLESQLESHIRSLQDISGADAEKVKLILIDVPHEPGDNKLGNDVVVVKHDNSKTNLMDFSGIISGINRSFESQLRRLRVFMHPEYFPRDIEERKTLEKQTIKFLGDKAG